MFDVFVLLARYARCRVEEAYKIMCWTLKLDQNMSLGAQESPAEILGPLAPNVSAQPVLH